MSGPDYASIPLGHHVDRARCLAKVAHAGQVDKSGRPYFTNHIQHAVSLFEQRIRIGGGFTARLLDHDEDLSLYKTTLIALYLHDIVEDTPLTHMGLLSLGFPARAVAAVQLLTRTREVASESYYRRILPVPEARLAKAADMDSNTAPERIRRLDPGTQERLLEKYLAGFEAIDMTPLFPLRRMLEEIEKVGP